MNSKGQAITNAPVPTNLCVPRAVFFDRGLVLFDPDARKLARRLCERIGIERTPEDLLSAYAKVIHARDVAERPDFSDAWFWSRWCAELHLSMRTDDVREVVTELEADPKRFWTELNPEAPQALAELRDRGIQLGIVSNTDGRLAEDIAGSALAGVFRVLVDSTVVKLSKPDPRIFLYAAKSARVQAEDCWFVGDDVRIDVRGAEGAGYGLAILYDRFGLYADGSIRIRSLRELVGLADAASRRA